MRNRQGEKMELLKSTEDALLFAASAKPEEIKTMEEDEVRLDVILEALAQLEKDYEDEGQDDMSDKIMQAEAVLMALKQFYSESIQHYKYLKGSI